MGIKGVAFFLALKKPRLYAKKLINPTVQLWRIQKFQRISMCRNTSKAGPEKTQSTKSRTKKHGRRVEPAELFFCWRFFPGCGCVLCVVFFEIEKNRCSETGMFCHEPWGWLRPNTDLFCEIILPLTQWRWADIFQGFKFCNPYGSGNIYIYDIFFTYIYHKGQPNVSGYTITVVDLMILMGKILYSKILPQLEALWLLAATTHSRKWCWCTIHGDSGGSSVGTCFFSTLWTRNQNSEVPKELASWEMNRNQEYLGYDVSLTWMQAQFVCFLCTI